jgi:hypothetical protein
MRNKINILMVVVVVAVLSVYAAVAGEDSEPSKEYQVKAAFIYNFIKFVDWPEPAAAEADQKTDNDNRQIIIGIIGRDPFGLAFEAVTKKKIHDKQVILKQFDGFAENSTEYKADGKTRYRYKDADALKACQVLFVCPSESRYFEEIIDIVKDNCVLTIGETKDFLETGGIIEFTTEQKKVKFEINLIAAEQAKLKISSKLLRLAKRVLKAEASENKES